jgi:hypothetical protein
LREDTLKTYRAGVFCYPVHLDSREERISDGRLKPRAREILGLFLKGYVFDFGWIDLFRREARNWNFLPFLKAAILEPRE